MRIVTPEQLTTALPELPGNPRIVIQGSFGTPRAPLGLLDTTTPEYQLFIVSGLGVLSDHEGARTETMLVGSGLCENPRVDYCPARLSTIPQLLRGPLPPSVIVVQTSRVVDEKVNLDIEMQVLPDAIDAAKQRGMILAAQINENLSSIHGDGVLPVDGIDLAVEIAESVPAASEARIGDESAAVGERLAVMMPDDTTFQPGVGTLSEAVVQALQDSYDLRVWTELMADGFPELLRSGALDETHPITTTFVYGSGELYTWTDDNLQLRLPRCEATNNLGNTVKQPAVTSINIALQVDLLGTVNVTRTNDRTISGTGGQADFIVGALQSPGGQTIITLRL